MLKSAAAAGQALAAAALDASRRAAESAAGVPAVRRGRGVASEVALARRDSTARGSRHLGFAKALVHEMPHTLAALECGVLSQGRATLVVRESACLDVEDRRRLDAELCADQSGLDGVGDARLAASAKAIAYRLDSRAVVDRAAHAETERTVTIRPAPDTMTYLTALLPVAHGVGVYAALKRAADTCGDGRSRGQIMADELVARVTGRPADVPAPIEVNLVITDEAMFGGSTTPARIDGYGPIPAAVAPGLVNVAVTDERSKATLRRLYRRPQGGALVALESRSRCLRRGLADFIGLRDNCVAPRTAMPRSATATTPDHIVGADLLAPPMARVCANAATMPRKRPGGRWPLQLTKKAVTQRTSLPQRARVTTPRHRRYSMSRMPSSARLRPGSALPWPTCMPPSAWRGHAWLPAAVISAASCLGASSMT